jgi:hypothetical protein
MATEAARLERKESTERKREKREKTLDSYRPSHGRHMVYFRFARDPPTIRWQSFRQADFPVLTSFWVSLQDCPIPDRQLLFGSLVSLKGFASIVPPEADVSAVAEAIVKGLDTPFGKKPFRVHVDPAQDSAEISSCRLRNQAAGRFLA